MVYVAVYLIFGVAVAMLLTNHKSVAKMNEKRKLLITCLVTFLWVPLYLYVLADYLHSEITKQGQI